MPVEPQHDTMVEALAKLSKVAWLGASEGVGWRLSSVVSAGSQR